MLSLQRAHHSAGRLRQGLESRRRRSKVELVRRPEPEGAPRVEGLGKPGETLTAKDFLSVERSARIRLVDRQCMHLFEESDCLLVKGLRPSASDLFEER